MSLPPLATDKAAALIKYPQRGICLYRCGNERFKLRVIAPEYKAKLFGSKGGK